MASSASSSASDFLERAAARRRELESHLPVEAAQPVTPEDDVHALKTLLWDTQARLGRLEQLLQSTSARVDRLERSEDSRGACANCTAREVELVQTLREAEALVREAYDSSARSPAAVSQPAKPAKRVTISVPANDQKKEANEDDKAEVNYPKGYDPRKRRMSVSAESPANAKQGPAKQFRKIPKSADVRARIGKVIENNILFRHLSDEQREECVDVMVKKEYQRGDILIQQGDLEAKFFFVLAEGEVEVLVNRTVVATLGVGRSFGEIALMYNTPRNATIRALTPEVVCWAMEGPAFRTMLMQYSVDQRSKYEKFLEDVKLFGALTKWERGTFADALQSIHFDDGDVIIRQGEAGDMFYIVEEGECVVTQSRSIHEGQAGRPITLMHLEPGQYFGELALLKDQPRAANVIAVGPVKTLGLNRRDFTMLMGPLTDILKRNISLYKTYDEMLGAQGEEESESPSSQPEVTASMSDFVASERNFLATLTGIVQGYLLPLRLTPASYMDPDVLQRIFSNVELLLKLSQDLVESLNGELTAGSVAVLAKFAPTIKFFEQFVAGRHLAQQLLRDLLQNTEAAELLEKVQKDDQLQSVHGGRTIAELLTETYERPAVYSRWFRKLAQSLDDQEQRAILERAADDAGQAMKNVSLCSDDAKVLFDVYKLLLSPPELADSELFCLMDTSSKQRRTLVRQSILEFSVGDSKPAPGYAFVFSDLLLLCRAAEEMFQVVKFLFAGDWEVKDQDGHVVVEHFTEDPLERVVIVADEAETRKWISDLSNSLVTE